FCSLGRAIHWFPFSNNDFWHQFTSIPEKFAHSTPRAGPIYSGRLHPVKSGGTTTKKYRIKMISQDFEVRRSLLLLLNNPVNPLFALRRLTRGRRPGSLGSNLALQGNLARSPGSGPPKHDRRCDEDGGIR